MTFKTLRTATIARQVQHDSHALAYDDTQPTTSRLLNIGLIRSSSMPQTITTELCLPACLPPLAAAAQVRAACQRSPGTRRYILEERRRLCGGAAGAPNSRLGHGSMGTCPLVRPGDCDSGPVLSRISLKSSAVSGAACGVAVCQGLYGGRWCIHCHSF